MIPWLFLAGGAVVGWCLASRRRRPWGEVPPWMIEELRKREQQRRYEYDQPRVYPPEPLPPDEQEPEEESDE